MNETLARLDALIRAANIRVISPAEVAQAFAALVAVVKEMLDATNTGVAEAKKAILEHLAKTDNRVDGVIEEATRVEGELREAIKNIELTPGKDGDDADEEAIFARLKAEIPAPLAGSPDTGDQIVAKLEDQPKKKRLHATALQGLEDLIKSLIPEAEKPTVRVIGGRAGIQMYIDGEKIGLVQTLNLLAGSGVSFSHVNKNGVLTLTVDSTAGPVAPWYLGEQITLDPDKETFTLAHAPTAKLEVLLDRQPQIMGVDITGTIDGVNQTFAFTSAVDDSLLTLVYANYQ